MPDTHDELPEILERGIDLLRHAPPVRDEWRAQLNAKLATQSRERTWLVRPAYAIAACLLCTLLGSAITSVLLTRRISAPSAIAVTLPPVRFDLIAPAATHVTIVGDFNGWNPETLPMTRSADGRTWQVEVKLAPGRYTYGFVVDGRLVRDPAAPETASDDFGISSSVLMVSRAGGST